MGLSPDLIWSKMTWTSSKPPLCFSFMLHFSEVFISVKTSASSPCPDPELNWASLRAYPRPPMLCNYCKMNTYSWLTRWRFCYTVLPWGNDVPGAVSRRVVTIITHALVRSRWKWNADMFWLTRWMFLTLYLQFANVT